MGPVRVYVALFGSGGVGSELLSQLDAQEEALRQQYDAEVVVVAICRSTCMAVDEKGLPIRSWTESTWVERDVASIEHSLSSLKAAESPVVCIDATSSEEVSGRYADWLAAGFHVVTANKKANSGPIEFYREIRKAKMAQRSLFLYEANVGAGLPVLKTLQDLVFAGDRVISVEGVLSGTLSYLFNEFSTERRFSEVVAQARELGFTEPDPREDLSGMDVARKVVIMARELGLEVELDSVPVRSLVPESLRDTVEVTVDDFMARLPDHDGDMARITASADERGKVLRYVGRIDVENRSCHVELQEYPRDHPFGALKGSDNILSFSTSRYSPESLVVRGPGAGNAVTAAGVFADLRLVFLRSGANA